MTSLLATFFGFQSARQLDTSSQLGLGDLSSDSRVDVGAGQALSGRTIQAFSGAQQLQVVVQGHESEYRFRWLLSDTLNVGEGNGNAA